MVRVQRATRWVNTASALLLAILCSLWIGSPWGAVGDLSPLRAGQQGASLNGPIDAKALRPSPTALAASRWREALKHGPPEHQGCAISPSSAWVKAGAVAQASERQLALIGPASIRSHHARDPPCGAGPTVATS
jgi:hypothetical protein